MIKLNKFPLGLPLVPTFDKFTFYKQYRVENSIDVLGISSDQMLLFMIG